MKSNILKRLSALAMTAVMAFSISGGVSAADAATATIDTSRSTSLTLYKYDLTGAENDGVWDSQSYVSTGIADEQVNTALSQYAIQGVEFTYHKLADLSIYKGTAADGHQETVPLYAFTEDTKSGSKETVDFLSALGLTTNDAYDEIARILAVVDGFQFNKCSPKRHIVYPLLFRVLCFCGLRISEALNLTVGDVHFEDGFFLLRNTKTSLDRLIPLDDNLRVRFMVYSEQMGFLRKDEYFFPSPDGSRYSLATMDTTFRDILFRAGIPYRGK